MFGKYNMDSDNIDGRKCIQSIACLDVATLLECDDYDLNSISDKCKKCDLDCVFSNNSQ